MLSISQVAKIKGCSPTTIRRIVLNSKYIKISRRTVDGKTVIGIPDVYLDKIKVRKVGRPSDEDLLSRLSD